MKRSLSPNLCLIRAEGARFARCPQKTLPIAIWIDLDVGTLQDQGMADAIELGSLRRPTPKIEVTLDENFVLGPDVSAAIASLPQSAFVRQALGEEDAP